MNKSELIETLATQYPQLPLETVEGAVRTIIEQLADRLEDGGRIEIRGFGSFCLHFREPRMGRNPKTGEQVQLAGKSVPHFKPGKTLREQVNSTH